MRGLGNKIKRKGILDLCRKRAEIICVQETHNTKDVENTWNIEWGREGYYSHGESNARGVAIFIRCNLNIKVVKIKRDEDGRVVIVEINHNGTIYAICNIYGPNKDSPEFFHKVSKLLEDTSEHKIVIGDYNVALQNMDRYNTQPNRNKNSREAINQLMEDYLLTDVWRERNPETLHFSWNKWKPNRVASRLDYALVSQGMSSHTANVMYVAAPNTDHQAFYICIQMETNERGKGYWKLNCQLLRNPQVIEEVNTLIEDILKTSTTQHPCTTWELMKDKVAKKLQNCSRRKASEKKLIISQLLEKITEMEERQNLTEADIDILLQSKSELNSLVNENTTAALFRSKVKWTELGERSSKYFYNLEKSRYNAKTCHTLIHEGKEIKEDKEIIETEKDFYDELYMKDDKVEFRAQNTYNVWATDSHISEMSKTMNIIEVANAIKQLKNGKTPGNDGLPIEFYKMFYPKIKTLLFDMYICVFEEEKLNTSASKGILNLIPKPGKDSRYIQNLRPITLLNVDYKIIEKVLANRMENAMHHIIHYDQKGFMKGRRSSGNIRKILDLIYFTDRDKLEALILSLDYKKCFDLISFDAILGALKFFKFPEFIYNWTKILYTDYTVQIQNNGHFSAPIQIERSVHQGGVNSTNYFLLVAEILALALRDNQRIKGIPVNDIINLLGQFADDMDMYLMANNHSLNEVFDCIETFHNHTGFTINYDKTKILRIGALKNTDAMLITQKQVAWTNEPINVLGVWVGNSEEDILELNYNPIADKAVAILKAWRKRNLSLIGKTNVVNTLIGSLFVYKMAVLPNIPEKIICKVENEITNFIWNDKKPKIALKTLKTSKECGGAGLIDLRKKEIAIKISWIQLLEQDETLANLAFESIQPDLKQWIFDCNLSPKDIGILEIRNTFWKHVLLAWCTYNYNYKSRTQDTILWYNSDIRIGNQPVFWKKPYRQGLFRVSQLYPNGTLISVAQAATLYHLNYMEFYSLVTAIPKGTKEAVCKQIHWHSLYAELLDQKGLVKTIYSELVKHQDVTDKVKNLWERDLQTQWSNNAYCQEIKNLYKVTNIPKYRSFQYRFMHRAMVLNTHLHKWKITSSDQCTFCGKYQETILHLFFHCEETIRIWEQIKGITRKYTQEEMHWTAEKVMLNRIHPNPRHVVNFICLVTKQYLYRQKCYGKKPAIQEITAEILNQERVEKYIAVKNGRALKHFKKWHPTTQQEYQERELERYISEYIGQM